MMKSRYRIISVIILAAAGSLWGDSSPRIIRGDFYQKLVINGYLKAREAEIFRGPESNSWEIQLKWMAPEGSEIKKGDQVIQFDTSNLATEIENLENTMQVKLDERKQKKVNFKHEVFGLKVAVMQAEIELKKAQMDAAVPRGIESDHHYEEKQLELKKKLQRYENAKTEQKLRINSLEAEIQKLEIEISEARIKLEKNQSMLEKMIIHATTSGTLLYETTWQGKVQAGDMVRRGQRVARIPKGDSLYVDAWMDETDILDIRKGQHVECILDAYPDQVFKGIIEDVLKSAENRKKWGRSNYFNVIISLKKLDMAIMKPGMSVKCLVSIHHIPDTIMVPIEQLILFNNRYWIKTKRSGIKNISPGRFNNFYMTIADDTRVKDGDELLPLQISEIQKNDKNK
jgi:multidrug efflux pump subunit AcrA (membrane-fusion protein)